MKRTAPSTATKLATQKAASRRASALVHLEYIDPQAQSVFVAGSFNDWHPAVTEMLNVGPGRWAKELTLVPGAYEYRLVVDGQWRADPACPDRAPNPFGGENSVLRVSP